MSVRSRILGPPVPKIPSGLIEVMDGLARDVLKNNPQNIYEFCAQHMQTLLEIRDGRALRPLLTLEQKIEKAQKKVKQRAEERQRAYDKKITEANNEQQVLSAGDAPCCGDDSEYCEKKEIKKASVDVEPEETGVINVIEKQMLENPAELISEINNDINDNKGVLNDIDDNDTGEEIDNEVKSNEEIVIVKDSYENEASSFLLEDKSETDDNTKCNEIDNRINNNLSKEIQLVIVAPDITKANNDNLTESLPVEAALKFECNGNAEKKILSPENSDIQLENQETEIIEIDVDTELQSAVENNIKDTTDEILSTVTTENEIISSVDNPQENTNFDVDKEQLEVDIDVSSKNNPLNNDDVESNLKTNDNLTKQHAEDLNESEISGDNKTLSVILSSNNTENNSVQNDESKTVEPTVGIDPVEIIISESITNELDQKSEQNTNPENVSGSMNNNEKNNSINTSMDLETAAITIQKVFRSFLFKTKTASYDDPTTVDISLLTEDKEKEENEVLNIKDRRHLGISRMDTVLQTVNEEKSLSLSTDDSSTISSAATVIQAHVRGFLVRNKLNLNKTISNNSLIDSDAPSIPSLEADSDNMKNKTVLNIHIVPEGGHFVSRDESILTSMDLSLDSSPPSSVNLHPLGYDKSERRKQLKREDAIQSVSPPSNNSGKLSEEHDSVKEVLTVESNTEIGLVTLRNSTSAELHDISEKEAPKIITEHDPNSDNPASDFASDEMDVITPFTEDRSPRESNNSTKLLHSGEFHDVVVPTNITRSDTSVVREFQNVLVYFILWNN